MRLDNIEIFIYLFIFFMSLIVFLYLPIRFCLHTFDYLCMMKSLGVGALLEFLYFPSVHRFISSIQASRMNLNFCVCIIDCNWIIVHLPVGRLYFSTHTFLNAVRSFSPIVAPHIHKTHVNYILKIVILIRNLISLIIRCAGN